MVLLIVLTVWGLTGLITDICMMIFWDGRDYTTSDLISGDTVLMIAGGLVVLVAAFCVIWDPSFKPHKSRVLFRGRKNAGS